MVRTRLPALLTVVKDINQPRYPTFRGIRNARRMKIPTWTPDNLEGIQRSYLGLDGSPTKVIKVFSPPRREGRVEMISGDSVEETTGLLGQKLVDDKVV